MWKGYYNHVDYKTRWRPQEEGRKVVSLNVYVDVNYLGGTSMLEITYLGCVSGFIWFVGGYI